MFRVVFADLDDIAFSYLIGGEGVVYEGLGHNYKPETVHK